jgi:hypothetical protein
MSTLICDGACDGVARQNPPHPWRMAVDVRRARLSCRLDLRFV